MTTQTDPAPADRQGPVRANGVRGQAFVLLLTLLVALAAGSCGGAEPAAEESPAPTAAAETLPELPETSPGERAESPQAKLASKRLQRLAQKVARKRPGTKKRSGPVTVSTSGPLGSLDVKVDLTRRAPEGADAQIGFAVANIPNRSSSQGLASSMRTLTAERPDFVTLNEVGRRSTSSLEAAAPGYTARRAATRDTSRGAAGQSLNNAVLYRADTWTEVASGIVRVVNDDQGFLRKNPFVWDRFAVWTVLKRADGVITSVLSTHMPTNPGKYPAQHGNPRLTRVQQYGQGMDTIVAMTRQLSAYGPVFVAGDMNSHPGQGSWTAASKMAGAGYGYAKDNGVMYLFHAIDTPVSSSRQVPVASDHAALLARVDISAAG